MKKFTRTSERGFTLIEVVLAIAVGLIIIAGVAVGYQYAKRSAITDNQRKDAATPSPSASVTATPAGQVITTPTPRPSATVAAEATLTVTNSAPADKKEFTSDEARGSLTFRWTTLVPKPKEPVTYRLKVWQLMEGQNGTQAMKTNQPVATKEGVDITEAPVAGLYTGPCKPPYLCDFVWVVEATTSGGTATAVSQPTTFSVAEPDNAGAGAGSPGY